MSRPVDLGLHATGSYGLSGPPGGVIRVWLCGGRAMRNGYPQDQCAHTSRQAARECPYRDGVRPEGVRQ